MNSRPPTPNHYRTQNFESTDLRGKSFPGAWQHANFCYVITGSSSILNLSRQVFSLILAFLAGFITAYAGATFSIFFDSNSWFLGLVIGFLLIFFFSITLRSGLTAALGSLSFVTAFLIVITVALAVRTIAGLTALSTLTIGGSVAGSVGLATAITFTRSQQLPLCCYALGLIIGSFFGLPIESTRSDFLWVIVFSLPVLGLGSYLGYCSLRHDPRYEILQALAIKLSTWRSTSFRASDLTAANFSNATLRYTDFSNTIITRTRWHNATFQQNNLRGTYLAEPKIRRLVTELDGQDQTFDRFDLRGINLDHANIIGASFIGADLTNATLKGANLTNAKLAQTQLYGADLTGAILTGAYIENWGISPETTLDSIQCDYIYLRLPTNENPDPYRKPDNRDEIFQSNDFTDFIAPILNTLKAYKQQTLTPASTSIPSKTLDLYHREGIDSIAAAIALQELINSNAQAQIQILSIEGVDQKIRIQASIANPTDPSPLNTRYFQRYKQLATQPSSNLQTLFETLATQHAQLRSLEARIAAATDSPLSYIAISPDSDTLPRRSALQRKRDRLHKAIEQQNQQLDTLEIELQATNDQWAAEMNEANRERLQRRISQLEDSLETGERKLAELEQQLNDVQAG